MATNGVIFRNGDLNKLKTAVNLRGKIAIDAATQITEESTLQAVILQRQLLDAAVTGTGSRRISKGVGNTAGRNETGEMIAAIEQEVTATSTRVSGKWGFLKDVQGYFFAQELGGGPNDNIPAAHSLLDSFIQIREEYIRRLVRMVGK